MSEAVKAACQARYGKYWDTMDERQRETAMSVMAPSIKAADAARAVPDEEVVKFLPAWDDVMLQSVLAQMRREGFTVIRTQERAMEVSDEMVEAALDMWFGDENWRRVRDDDHMPDRWRAEMRRALRAALAVMPDQYRLGWIAGRDAAAEVCRREGKSVKAEDYDNYAIGREVGCHACMTTIKAMEPPA